METRAHATPGAALLLRLALGAALGLVFLLASLIFGSSSARADDAAEPGLVQGVLDTVLPADSSLGSAVNAVTEKPVAVVDRVVAKPVAVVERIVEKVVVKTVVPVVEPAVEPVLDAAPAVVSSKPVAVEPAAVAAVVPVEAPAGAAPADDHATPAEAPAAPGDSTLTPGPALGSSGGAGGVVGDLGGFGVLGPVASSTQFSPAGFSPPGAPTFASDTTPD
ncbi:hypothetical protein EYE40_11445 [Glaciihabitans arcticus]|uniref:Uncharacterized protein n=1 Tax=Glaciihabitans arcticus TaxID=2668039 RepID=A0A4Q9GYS5_9MICO|nr:hypothetical protein [Glaciihabitans arcticus]TBN57963.1 hypothetical protein EYE40_11445 [Glaciihabitans arcticus]